MTSAFLNVFNETVLIICSVYVCVWYLVKCVHAM